MRQHRLIRMTASLLLFVVAGTVGLVCLFNFAFQRMSHDEFVALARANADFIHDTHLSGSDRLAGYLGRLQGVEVQFQSAPVSDPRQEAVTTPVEPGLDLTLIRPKPSLTAVLVRPITLASLAIFWMLWSALAWAVAVPYFKAQRLAMLGGMATALAHEIRNPIAAIRLHGQLLTEAQPGAAGLIVAEADRIDDLVNQWMFLARPAPPHKSEVAVGHLLAETVQLLQPAARHANVDIRVDAAREWRMQADSSRLRQVFYNIILNAIQAMSTGGTLTITARDGVINFADTGPGFSPTALRRWAEMLYSEKEGGMGVGLSVAHEIIQAHGGRLVAVNQSGGGALVRMMV
jgi:signal transduction histidine kinase